MQHNGIKVVSLNVNGLNNPIKRGKVLAKFKKEKIQIIFLQETHLSRQEHEKIKKFGYKNTYYSSFRLSTRRGVATLISNTTKFEMIKEISDREGRYILVKGKLDDQIVTLINVYAPPDCEKSFFKSLFDIISMEAEGIMICAGDLNVVLNYTLDTTSTKKNKKQINRYINTMMSELGLVDVWRDTHPLERDYTHYSIPHSIYSRIDYFLMNTRDRYRVKECKIGVADLSDHCAIYLTIHLNCRQKNTVWRLNVGTLNNEGLVEGIKGEIETYKEENDNGQVDPTILWDAMKAVIRGKLIAQTTFYKKVKLETYQKQIEKLKGLELNHKKTRDPETLNQIKEARKKVEDILMDEMEKKTRFLKQTYYEGGSKASKMLARRIKKQQDLNTIYKIRDPKTNKLLNEPEEI